MLTNAAELDLFCEWKARLFFQALPGLQKMKCNFKADINREILTYYKIVERVYGCCKFDHFELET